MDALTSPSAKDVGNDSKGVSILARSLFRTMTQQGYSQDQIIALSTELIQLVHEDLRRAAEAKLVAE